MRAVRASSVSGRSTHGVFRIKEVRGWSLWLDGRFR
jgi:hypothetical protein